MNNLINSTKYNSKKTIVKRLLENSKIDHSKGYVADIESNLLKTIKVEDFKGDLKSGNGNELNSKFMALYSSSALGVNFFGFFKQHVDKINILGENNFQVGQFEKKLPTGLRGTPPNLDFFLENDNCVIGFESKFLEPLSLTLPKFSNSYSVSFLQTIDKGLPEIVNYYNSYEKKAFLDTAQLLKHTIGLIKNKDKKKAKLIYVYWQPLNHNDFPEYETHFNELLEFEQRIKNVSGVSFHHFSYQELHNLFSSNIIFKEHLSYFKERYLMSI